MITSGLPVVGLGQELTDLVRGDGEGNAGRHFQRVDPDHLAVLERKTRDLESDVKKKLKLGFDTFSK